MSEKRRDYISWDEYFMGVAMLTGMRSKDPNTQVGACIVSADHKILSMGYNGLPTGCSDDEYSREENITYEESEKSVSVTDTDFTVWAEYDRSHCTLHDVRHMARQEI